MKKVLMTWGGWDGHDPEQTTGIFASLMRAEGCEVTITDTLECLTDRDLTQYDLIVPCWTMSEISSDQCEALAAAVQSGVGFGGWHGGAGWGMETRSLYYNRRALPPCGSQRI